MAAQRFHNPVPYRREYVGPAAQMFGNIFANRAGIGSLPGARNFAGRGFQRFGQGLQRLPFAKGIGNLLNRVARPVNRGMEFTQAMNPQNMMMSGIGGLFGGRREGGRGGPLGFGLFGGRRQPRQRRGGPLGFGLFGGRRRRPRRQQIDPSMMNTRSDQQDFLNSLSAPQQISQVSANPYLADQQATMSLMAAQDPFAGQGPIGPGMDMDSYGFGMNIGTPDAAGIAAGVERDVKASLPFEQIDDPTGRFYQLIDRNTGNMIMAGRHHRDHRPKGPSLQRMGGGL